MEKGDNIPTSWLARSATAAALLSVSLAFTVADAQELGDAQIASASAVGVSGTGDSRGPSFAPNGNVLVFASSATNLDARKRNPDTSDIFLQSLTSSGFYNVSLLVQRKNRAGADNGAPTRGAELPTLSQLSSDRVSYAVSFESTSDDLLSEDSTSPDPTSDKRQVYLRLMPSGEQILVSRAFGSEREGGNSNSTGGSVALVGESPLKYRVAFLSTAGNLTDPSTGPPANRIYPQPFVATITKASSGKWVVEVVKVPAEGDGDFRDLSMSADGQTIIYSTNSAELGADSARFDTFVQDHAGRTPPALVSSYARANNLMTVGGSLSYSGEVRLFKMARSYNGSQAQFDLYWNRAATANDYPSQVNTDANGAPSALGVFSARMGPNGDYVVFSSAARDLTTLPDSTALVNRQTYLKSLSSGLVWLTSQRSSLGGGYLFGQGGDSSLPTIGGAGFSARKFFTAFESSASNLAPLTTTESQVYRVAIELPPPPLSEGAPIDSPPDLVVKKRAVTIFFQEFSPPASQASATHPAAAARVRYSVTIKENSTRKRIQLVTAKNRVTVRKLSPGRYTVRYRVSSPKPGGGTIQSKYSPKAPMTIK